MWHLIQRIFLYPGDRLCDACHVSAGDDRMMIRTLVNMLVWDLVVVVLAVIIY